MPTSEEATITDISPGVSATAAPLTVQATTPPTANHSANVVHPCRGVAHTAHLMNVGMLVDSNAAGPSTYDICARLTVIRLVYLPNTR